MVYMNKSKEKLGLEIYNDLKGDYINVERIDMESDDVFCIYADDDTLWKIFEDTINEFKSIEFDAGRGESHFLRVII